MLPAQALVNPFKFKYLPALFGIHLVHFWVKEAADLPVVVLQRF
jgi:hypothetical protein